MGITIIPTRTTADPASAADINTLMANDQAMYGSLGKPDFLLDIPAGAWEFGSSNSAGVVEETIGENKIVSNRFDDTIEEYVETMFRLPPDWNKSELPSIELYGYAETPTTGTAVVYFEADCAVISATGSLDVSAVNCGSAEFNPGSTQDQVNKTEFDLDIYGNCGGTAGDLCILRLKRVPDQDTFVDDYALIHTRIRIPRI